MELEHCQLEMKYEVLRVQSSAAQARLMASLAQCGQQSPVLVVRAAECERPVLIDGYRRVASLRALGNDLVMATELAMSESEALLFRHRMASTEPRSALEDGWLLRELNEEFGLSEDELARRFVRSKSWVSRRLGLVRELPQSVQEEVRQGRLSSQAAMKHLVPLARANEAQVVMLAARAGAARLSVRQLGEVTAAWRQADAETRWRIVERPELFIRAKESRERAQSAAAVEAERALLNDLERIGWLARRALTQLKARWVRTATLSTQELVQASWDAASRELARFNDALLYGLGHD